MMNDTETARARAFYAGTYDASVSDWPGELAFYRRWAEGEAASRHGVLELACGIGRIAVRLAQAGCEVVGLDVSPAMLAVARGKSSGLGNLAWVEADMRGFDLSRRFGLVIVPGHAFQNLTEPEDQVSCLMAVRRHLEPGGALILHLDHLELDWLGEMVRSGRCEDPPGEFVHPTTGQRIQTSSTWRFEPATQTVILSTVWKALGEDGEVTDRWESGPLRIHCAFRFEIEHLLGRCGFAIEAIYGDFAGTPLEDRSSEMIWVARPPRSATVT
jgi:SAM-dependent methyltransferase